MTEASGGSFQVMLECANTHNCLLACRHLSSLAAVCTLRGASPNGILGSHPSKREPKMRTFPLERDSSRRILSFFELCSKRTIVADKSVCLLGCTS